MGDYDDLVTQRFHDGKRLGQLETEDRIRRELSIDGKSPVIETCNSGHKWFKTGPDHQPCPECLRLSNEQLRTRVAELEQLVVRLRREAEKVRVDLNKDQVLRGESCYIVRSNPDVGDAEPQMPPGWIEPAPDNYPYPTKQPPPCPECGKTDMVVVGVFSAFNEGVLESPFFCKRCHHEWVAGWPE